MTADEYENTTLAEMKKKRWRTRVELSSGVLFVPAGTEVSIVRKRNGLDIRGVKCGCCGVAVFMRKVEHHHLEEIT